MDKIKTRNPRQRLIISYRFLMAKNHIDGFFCKSVESAKKIIAKRRGVHKAHFYNGDGELIKLK